MKIPSFLPDNEQNSRPVMIMIVTDSLSEFPAD